MFLITKNNTRLLCETVEDLLDFITTNVMFTYTVEHIELHKPKQQSDRNTITLAKQPQNEPVPLSRVKDPTKDQLK